MSTECAGEASKNNLISNVRWEENKIINARAKTKDKEKEDRTIEILWDATGRERMRSKKRELTRERKK